MNRLEKLKAFSRHVGAVVLPMMFLFPQALSAWGPSGHKAVALIAQDRLSPEARKKIRDIIGTDAGLEQIAICADIIRDPKGRGISCGHAFHLDPNPASAGWHYIDIPISDSPDADSLERYCGAGGQKDNCVVDQVRDDVKTLQDSSTTQTQKQIALMFLVHFVGDMHQPLHCATEKLDGGKTDRGGNDKMVTFMHVPTNLHKLWDNIIEPPVISDPSNVSLESMSLNPWSLARQLEKDIAGKNVGPWTSGDIPVDAALESFEIVWKTIYPAYKAPGGQNIGEDYQKEMQPIAFERIERAGVRLAHLLEQALGNAPTPETPSQDTDAPAENSN